MIPAEAAISRLQRDLTFGALLKFVLLGGAVACLLLGPMFNLSVEGTIAMVSIAVIWLMLSHRSAKGSRMVMDVPSLISAGRFEDAERQIELALRNFSLFRTVKLLSVHHLALLRHAQGRWQDAAVLSRGLQRQKLGGLVGLARPSRIILADSLLQMGDLAGTHETIMQMYQQRLSLGEAMNLLALQMDYESRIGAWQAMFAGLKSKLQLAELMTAGDSARTQALLALAARKLSQHQWSEWLRRRAELLVDVQELARSRPILWELWQSEKDSKASG